MKKISPLILFSAIALTLGSVVLLNSCGKGDSDSDLSDLDSPYPNHQGQDYSGEKNFAKLLNGYAQAKSAQTPWAGFWWPYTKNGIASGGSGGSTAGKYDAARGGTTHSQSWEVEHHGAGVKGVQGWWGHCNGWCVASALYPEPNADVKVNGVTFTIADIKALLTEAGMEASADFYGNRVDWASDFNTPKVDDPFPGQYFLVMTNYMGKLRQPVLIDRFTGDQIWNQPVAGYKFEYPKPADYLGASPEAPNVYRIRLNSTIWWSNDGVDPGCQTPPFEYQSDGYYFQSRDLQMEVWLDGPVVFGSDGKITSSGNVIVSRQGEYLVGGTWLGDATSMSDGHPDYIWVPYSLLKPTEFSNPELDIDWIKAHILSGGVDDSSVSPRPVDPAPHPSGRPSGEPTTTPTPEPTSHPTSQPRPTSEPTFIPTSVPTSIPTFIPTSVPTSIPTGIPTTIPTGRPPRP